MEKYTITFTEEEALERYLTDSFASEKAEAQRESKEGKTVLFITTTSAVFRTVVADAIAIWYKGKTIEKSCKRYENGILYAAFLGTIIGEELENDREKITEKLPKEKDINLDGIFRFLLNDLEETWKALGILSGKLLLSCREDEDVIALIRYFLGNTKTMNRTLIVDKTVYYDDTDSDMPCLCFFKSSEENIALNLLIRRPSEIIVPLPKQHDIELIKIIKKLGE